jgi:hypothetical protein
MENPSQKTQRRKKQRTEGPPEGAIVCTSPTNTPQQQEEKEKEKENGIAARAESALVPSVKGPRAALPVRDFAKSYLAEHFPRALEFLENCPAYEVITYVTLRCCERGTDPAEDRFVARLWRDALPDTDELDHAMTFSLADTRRLPFTNNWFRSEAPIPEWSKYASERAHLGPHVPAVVCLRWPERERGGEWVDLGAVVLNRNCSEAEIWFGTLMEEEPKAKSRFCVRAWDNSGQCYVDDPGALKRTRDTLFGYDHVIDSVLENWETLKAKKDFLRSIGEHSSLNYRFTGVPGMGKSTAARVIATELDVPLHVVNIADVPSDKFSRALSPEPECLVLVEDFDRFAAQLMANGARFSAFLNALSGVQGGVCVLRFFTMNHGEFIDSSIVLRQRFAVHHRFGSLQGEPYKKRILSLYPQADDEDVNRLADYCVENRIAMRTLMDHLVLHLCDKNVAPLEAIWSARYTMIEAVPDSEAMKEDKQMVHPAELYEAAMAPPASAAPSAVSSAQQQELEEQKRKIIDIVSGIVGGGPRLA